MDMQSQSEEKGVAGHVERFVYWILKRLLGAIQYFFGFVRSSLRKPNRGDSFKSASRVVTRSGKDCNGPLKIVDGFVELSHHI